MITPPRLKPNDLVAIITPAGASSEPDAVEQAVKNMESLGLRAKPMPYTNRRWGYLGGTDNERAEDFNAAVIDSEVKAIVCLRGGYGTMRMLPMVDYQAFRKHAKIVMGFSDITGLLNALTRKSKVVTYHGPVAENKFLNFEGEWARKALFGQGPLGVLGNPAPLNGRAVTPSAKTIQSGKAKGRLIGGNLSLIAPCAGTEFGPDFQDAILFLEDVNEHTYRVDRLLTGLWLGGHLAKVKGIVLGDFVPHKEDNDPTIDPKKTFSMIEVFDHLTMWTKAPIFSGLYAGHIRDKLTLPIGAEVEMDADARTLTVLS
jgi:muramoyltetrapeptide carboxypeptidase